MKKEDIIELWKQGYSVEQITNKSLVVRKSKDEKVKKIIMHRVESIILEYQS